jgi:signal transduction histidine kinase
VVDLLKEIVKAGNRSKEIIEDINEYLLTVSKANYELQKAPAKDVVEEALQVSKAYENCDVDITSEIDEDVMVAKVPMRHVLLNLISNAVKYSNKDRCALSVRMYENKSSVFIDIGDNGPGIRDVDQKRIFQLFKRGSDVSGLPGKGIGLAIAAKLLQVHNGSIGVKSEYGKGAVFTVSMPKDSVDLEEV